MVYYLLFGGIFFLAITEQFRKKKVNITDIKTIHKKKGCIYISPYKILALTVVVILVLFAGTRVSTGIDINTYFNSYSKVDAITLRDIEPFFIILAKMVPNYETLIFIYAFLSVLLFTSVVEKFSTLFFLSIAVYFSQIYLQYNMGIMRQGLALAITLYGLRYVAEEKIDSKYWIFYICGVLVHYSSIITIFLLFFRKIRINNKVMLVAVFSALLLSAFNPMQHLLSIIFNILPSNNVFLKYINFASVDSIIFDFSISNLRRALLICLFCHYFPEAEKDENIHYNIFLNSYFIGTMIYYLFKSYSIISGRLGMYFCCVEVLLLPLCVYKEKNRIIKVGWLVLIMMYCLYYIHTIINFNNGSWMNESYLPYQSWLFGKLG